MPVTIEDMINEGSITPAQVQNMGYRWDSLVVGGDAYKIRQQWLDKATK